MSYPHKGVLLVLLMRETDEKGEIRYSNDGCFRRRASSIRCVGCLPNAGRSEWKASLTSLSFLRVTYF